MTGSEGGGPPPAGVVEVTVWLGRAEWAALETAAGREQLTVGQFARRGVAAFLTRPRPPADPLHAGPAPHGEGPPGGCDGP